MWDPPRGADQKEHGLGDENVALATYMYARQKPIVKHLSVCDEPVGPFDPSDQT